MRKKKVFKKLCAPDEIIGFLGQVRLVRKATGKCDLIGGTDENQGFAREWCSRFAPFLDFTVATVQEHAMVVESPY